MGFSNWAKRLDDRVLAPVERRQRPPWTRRMSFVLGMNGAIIFGGGFLLRVLLPGRLHSTGSELVIYGFVGLAGLLSMAWAYLNPRRTDD